MHELKSWGVILHLENWISHSENQPMKMIKCSRLVPTTIIVYDKSRKFKGERVATSCQHAHRKTAGRRQSRLFADITVSHETTPLCFVQLLLVITLWVFYECDIRHRIPLKIPTCMSSIHCSTHTSQPSHTYSPRKTISVLISPELWRRKFLRKAVTLSTVMFPQTTMYLGSKNRGGGPCEEQKHLAVKV